MVLTCSLIFSNCTELSGILILICWYSARKSFVLLNVYTRKVCQGIWFSARFSALKCVLLSWLHNTLFCCCCCCYNLFFFGFFGFFWNLFTTNFLKNYHDLDVHNQQTLSTTAIKYINYFLIYTKYCNANNNYTW